MDPQRFDSLARALAAPRTRRSVLGGLMGGWLAGLLGRQGGDARQASTDCKSFCQGRPPGERGKCTSDAAKGRGLCYECGPAAINPAAVACQGKDCGQVVNACGATVTCGSGACAPLQTCGGGGTPNVCGAAGDHRAAGHDGPADHRAAGGVREHLHRDPGPDHLRLRLPAGRDGLHPVRGDHGAQPLRLRVVRERDAGVRGRGQVRCGDTLQQRRRVRHHHRRPRRRRPRLLPRGQLHAAGRVPRPLRAVLPVAEAWLPRRRVAVPPNTRRPGVSARKGGAG